MDGTHSISPSYKNGRIHLSKNNKGVPERSLDDLLGAGSSDQRILIFTLIYNIIQYTALKNIIE